MQDHHRAFLQSLNANQTSHSGRTLFEHLKGVHDLLRDWDNPGYVCVAGLFHSIYGTKAFTHQSMSDRDKLVEMIGARAEELVHLFCVAADRPLFESIKDDGVRLDLMEIEAANLLEQGGSKKSLRKLMGQKLSNGARAALNCGVV